MEYLGQRIELMEQISGWVAIWWHEAGMIQIGFFPTAPAAWEAAVELIQRDLAVRSLIEVMESWRDDRLINDWEYSFSINSLVEFVLAQEPS